MWLRVFCVAMALAVAMVTAEDADGTPGDAHVTVPRDEDPPGEAFGVPPKCRDKEEGQGGSCVPAGTAPGSALDTPPRCPEGEVDVNGQCTKTYPLPPPEEE